MSPRGVRCLLSLHKFFRSVPGRNRTFLVRLRKPLPIQSASRTLSLGTPTQNRTELIDLEERLVFQH